jgi:hypothetical protein
MMVTHYQCDRSCAIYSLSNEFPSGSKIKFEPAINGVGIAQNNWEDWEKKGMRQTEPLTFPPRRPWPATPCVQSSISFHMCCLPVPMPIADLGVNSHNSEEIRIIIMPLPALRNTQLSGKMSPWQRA